MGNREERKERPFGPFSLELDGETASYFIFVFRDHVRSLAAAVDHLERFGDPSQILPERRRAHELARMHLDRFETAAAIGAGIVVLPDGFPA